VKNGRFLLISAIVISLLALQGTQVWASPALNATDANTANEMASTVSTAHMSVDLVFPTSAYLGQTETISANTTATSSGTIVSFSIGVFALIDGQLMKIASQTIVANAYVAVGEKWRSSLVVAIPADAQSALLTGTITEVWQQAPNYYSSYHVTPYYNMPYYTQNSQYYNYNYNYNTQQQIHLPRQAPAPETVGLFNGVAAPETARLPNGVVALYTPSGGTIQLNPQLALPNGNAAFQKSPQTYVQPYVNMNIHQRSYMSRPATYYGPNPATYYGPNFTNYPPNYLPNYPPTQVTSQQTFALTYILG
jgi:sulfur relay (sulfurtransferase) DsrC/TusE family protein